MFDSYTPDLNLFCFRTLYGMILTIGCTPFPYLISLHHLFLCIISSILTIFYLYSKNMWQDPYLLSKYTIIPSIFPAGLMAGEMPSIFRRPSVIRTYVTQYLRICSSFFSDFLHDVRRS